MDTPRVRTSGDFGRVYDLDDPAPYYAGLSRTDYRMPTVVAAWVREHEPTLREAVAATDRPLRVLDFACGYGFNGATLLHDLSTHEVYAHYASDLRAPGDPGASWAEDAAMFRSRRVAEAGLHVIGLDIAASAVEYATTIGLIHEGFTDDLASGPPTAEFSAVLETVDLVIESGAIGSLYAVAFEAILGAADRPTGPWFLYCPRPDVDRRPVERLWQARGYSNETCLPAVAYRRPLDSAEARLVEEGTAAAGNDPAKAIVDGYISVDVQLARPISP